MSDRRDLERVREWWERSRIRWLEYRAAAAQGRATAAALEARWHSAVRKLAEALGEAEVPTYYGRNGLVGADPPEVREG